MMGKRARFTFPEGSPKAFGMAAAKNDAGWARHSSRGHRRLDVLLRPFLRIGDGALFAQAASVAPFGRGIIRRSPNSFRCSGKIRAVS